MGELRYIWFDLGYTLVYTKREAGMKSLLDKLGYPVDAEIVKLAYHLADKYFMREHRGLLCRPGSEYLERYYRKLAEILNCGIGEGELLEAYNMRTAGERHWFAYESALEVLALLKRKSIGTGLISNWDDSARKVLGENGLDKELDAVFISSEVGLEKPDRRIFELALSKKGIPPEQCLYVGDNYYDDAIGARQVGIKPVIINPYGFVGVEELVDVDIISNIRDLPNYLGIDTVTSF